MIQNIAINVCIAFIFMVVGKFIKILGLDNLYDFYICLVYVLLASFIKTYWLGI